MDSEVVALNVSRIKSDETLDESFRFSFSPEFDADLVKGYFVRFHAIIPHKNGMVYETEYRSQFRTDNKITEQFKESKFIYINSPAIAYPFFRAFVANLMLVSGHEPLMLPTINFVSLYEKNQKEHVEQMDPTQ
ncbi:hypothetical protein TUM3811_30760 [Shewanella algae]|nr:hypothetical protein TUM3811_30760 [Shewanella algae]